MQIGTISRPNPIESKLKLSKTDVMYPLSESIALIVVTNDRVGCIEIVLSFLMINTKDKTLLTTIKIKIEHNDWACHTFFSGWWLYVE